MITLVKHSECSGNIMEEVLSAYLDMSFKVFFRGLDAPWSTVIAEAQHGSLADTLENRAIASCFAVTS
jgi:hypothetical protein